MPDTAYKKYTEKARRGIKGEAYFESLIVDYAIPHRIARQNDLGVDFLCEWIYGDRPTGTLFCAQVKSTTGDTAAVRPQQPLHVNDLDEYALGGADKIGEPILNYWKGLGLPAFLFEIVESDSDGQSQIDCYYKRYTPLLDGHPGPDEESGTKPFFKVNKGADFLAFGKNGGGGFARDLMIDFVRMQYWKGHIMPIRPEDFGLQQLDDEEEILVIFDEIAGWHREKITETWHLTGNVLSRLNGG